MSTDQDASGQQEPKPATMPAPKKAAVKEEPWTSTFEGGPFAVSLPATAPLALRLFDAYNVEPGGPPATITLPPGEVGEHQLVDLRRRFDVEPAVPVAAKPDPRMTKS